MHLFSNPAAPISWNGCLALSLSLSADVSPRARSAAVTAAGSLVKFFIWEIGYMRSIDIIEDRAGWYIIWGVTVWVPSVYTLHTRVLVNLPSGLDWPTALLIFAVGIVGVLLNFWTDDERQRFREANGAIEVWGKVPTFIPATYEVLNAETGLLETRTTKLLASGWWGVARHVAYAFELMAAFSWGLLANPGTHGVLPLFYPVYLTILLVHRARRDEHKCAAKYGAAYEEYVTKVKWSIVPGLY